MAALDVSPAGCGVVEDSPSGPGAGLTVRRSLAGGTLPLLADVLAARDAEVPAT